MRKPNVTERCARARTETSGEKLAKFAQDKSPRVRLEVAKNPHTPLPVLLQLAKDESKQVRRYANLVLSASEYRLYCLAGDPSTRPELLHQLSQYRRWWGIRGQVAQNPSTPPELLFQLARDEEPLVRERVARNPSCPLELLGELAKDPHDYVKEAAVSNPNAPLEWALGWALSVARECSLCGECLPPGVVKKLVAHLDALPQDPGLWSLIWANASEETKRLIEAHPFGRGIALLARLAS